MDRSSGSAPHNQHRPRDSGRLAGPGSSNKKKRRLSFTPSPPGSPGGQEPHHGQHLGPQHQQLTPSSAPYHSHQSHSNPHGTTALPSLSSLLNSDLPTVTSPFSNPSLSPLQSTSHTGYPFHPAQQHHHHQQQQQHLQYPPDRSQHRHNSPLAHTSYPTGSSASLYANHSPQALVTPMLHHQVFASSPPNHPQSLHQPHQPSHTQGQQHPQTSFAEPAGHRSGVASPSASPSSTKFLPPPSTYTASSATSPSQQQSRHEYHSQSSMAPGHPLATWAPGDPSLPLATSPDARSRTQSHTPVPQQQPNQPIPYPSHASPVSHSYSNVPPQSASATGYSSPAVSYASLSDRGDSPAPSQHHSGTPHSHQHSSHGSSFNGDIAEVPAHVTAGLTGRPLVEARRKWRKQAGLTGPGKNWRKGLKKEQFPASKGGEPTASGGSGGAPSPSPSATWNSTAQQHPSQQPAAGVQAPAHPSAIEGNALDLPTPSISMALAPQSAPSGPPVENSSTTAVFTPNPTSATATAPATTTSTSTSISTTNTFSQYTYARQTAPHQKFNTGLAPVQPLLGKGHPAKDVRPRRWGWARRPIKGISGAAWSVGSWIGEEQSPLRDILDSTSNPTPSATLASARSGAASPAPTPPPPSMLNNSNNNNNNGGIVGSSSTSSSSSSHPSIATASLPLPGSYPQAHTSSSLPPPLLPPPTLTTKPMKPSALSTSIVAPSHLDGSTATTTPMSSTMGSPAPMAGEEEGSVSDIRDEMAMVEG